MAKQPKGLFTESQIKAQAKIFRKRYDAARSYLSARLWNALLDQFVLEWLATPMPPGVVYSPADIRELRAQLTLATNDLQV